MVIGFSGVFVRALRHEFAGEVEVEFIGSASIESFHADGDRYG